MLPTVESDPYYYLYLPLEDVSTAMVLKNDFKTFPAVAK